MRKLFAIVMLTVYLFNLAGYSFLFRYYIHQSDQVISKQADLNDFSGITLTEIKIKLNLPYLTDWSDYQRYDGEMEVNGVHYNYIKRKVSQDTLYILCLPNDIKTQLYQTKTDYAVKANDMPSEKQNKNSAFKKIIMTEVGKIQSVQFNFISFDRGINTANASSCSPVCDTFIAYIGQPPEPVC